MADIDKSLDSITKGIDKKNDALMMMSPECNWAQFLTPAPFTIAILGELLLISTDTDFSKLSLHEDDGWRNVGSVFMEFIEH
jgi:hypothetical protein